MTAIISILIVLASILLIVVVFVQNPKGGGLSSDFGAAHQLGGVKKTNDFIDKATWYLAIIVVVSSIGLTAYMNSGKKKVVAPTEQPGQPGPQGGAPQGQQGGAPQGGQQQ